ncbi:MAG: PsbP-related protein [Bacteroidota bacterium]
MTRSICISFLILLPFLSVAQQWKTFSDSSIAFTTKYPANWINKIKENNRVFFTSPSDGRSDNFYENVNVSVIQNAAYGNQVKIKDVIPTVIDNLKTVFDEFKSESQRYFKWNKADACEIIYSGYNKTNADYRVRMTQWFCFYKTRLYTVTFTALANTNIHNVTAKKIMNGIIFK